MSSLTRQAEQRRAAKDSRDELDFQSTLRQEVEEDLKRVGVREPVESSLEGEGYAAAPMDLSLLLDCTGTVIRYGWVPGREDSCLFNDS